MNKEDAKRKFDDLAHHFDRKLRMAMSDAIDMYDLIKDHPEEEFMLSESVSHTIGVAHKALEQFNEHLK